MFKIQLFTLIRFISIFVSSLYIAVFAVEPVGKELEESLKAGKYHY